jgi:acetylornithine deacetylase/succinyl-diaminopimelate desuccinylase-like protein
MKREFDRLGFSDVHVHETPLHPAITAKILSSRAEAPTVLVYGHVDVQPAEPLREWASPPFEVTRRNGRLYGRGTTDDKGQLLMHLRAVEALLSSGELPVNLLFLVDAEEEIGSPSLPAILESCPGLGEVDCMVVSDSPMLATNVPAVGYSLRGLVYLEITVRALADDKHSGQYGGAVPNAAKELVDLVASLHDQDGRVTVPGFYDEVAEISSTEIDMLRSLPFDERAWLDAVGASRPCGEEGFSTLERTWTRPTLELNGLISGHSGPGPKTIVPAVATAKMSMRLVGHQDPDRLGQLLVDYVGRHVSDNVSVTAEYAVSSRAVTTPYDSAAVNAALEALHTAFGTQAYTIRDGGTIPAVAMLQSSFGIDAVLLGLGSPDENKHAPNEWLAIEHFRQGPVAIVEFLRRLAAEPEIVHT